ncbi:MAG: hypothetical protein QM492_08665 [Rhodobacterales bacterium]
MTKVILEGDHLVIVDRQGEFFILYDPGVSAGPSVVETQISIDEVRKAMLSVKDAMLSAQDSYEVVLAAQNRNMARGDPAWAASSEQDLHLVTWCE